MHSLKRAGHVIRVGTIRLWARKRSEGQPWGQIAAEERCGLKAHDVSSAVYKAISLNAVPQKYLGWYHMEETS